MKLIWLCAGLGVLAGCGDDGASACAVPSEIFEITSYKKAVDQCGPGDDERLETIQQEGPTHFLMTCQLMFGQKIVTATSCSDLEACQAQARMVEADDTVQVNPSSAYAFAMTHQAQVTSSVAACEQVTYMESSVTAENNTATLSMSTWNLMGISEDGMGFCSSDEAQDMASNRPCDEYLSVSGRRVM
ncbi:MAG: hypothetical protein VX589_00045 [Myxococcota bacterium]|nr:hypothetical protein [Myxococcota bacterium]